MKFVVKLIYVILPLLIIVSDVAYSQNYLPVDMFGSRYRYIGSYGRNGQWMGKINSVNQEIGIVISSNTIDGRTRGFCSISLQTGGTVMFNYLGSYNNGWYLFNLDSEIYTSTFGYKYIPSVLKTYVKVNSNYSKVQYSPQGNQVDEYERIYK